MKSALEHELLLSGWYLVKIRILRIVFTHRYITLLNREKNRLSPLHIKLAMMKQFTKAFNKEEECFNKYICKTFPKLSMEKLKVGIFDGSQIGTVIKNTNFIEVMTDSESET